MQANIERIPFLKSLDPLLVQNIYFLSKGSCFRVGAFYQMFLISCSQMRLPQWGKGPFLACIHRILFYLLLILLFCFLSATWLSHGQF